MRKIKQSVGTESGYREEAILTWMVREIFSEEVTCEHIGCGKIWGRNTPSISNSK